MNFFGEKKVNSKKIAIIGSGVAGMASAVRLAAQGHDVHVFEKNNDPGGKLTFFKLGQYAFDAGPSLFTQPQLIEELFSDCGVPMDKYFSYSRAEIACRYFFTSGKELTAWAHPDSLAEEMQKSLGEDAATIRKYLARAKDSYEHLGQLFLTNSLHKWGTFFQKKVFPALFSTRPSYLLQSMNAYNASWFSQPETVQLFNRYATYNGSNPYVAPAMLTMIPHLEFNEGTFYPKGGMISITQALVALAQELGVCFHMNAEVTEIQTNKNKVSGLTANGERHSFDLVVSNMDAYYTYKKLLKNEKKAANIKKQERSSSAMIFYWGINREFAQLDLHNIFFADNYKAEFDHLFHRKSLYQDPTIYINITSKMEAGMAPSGGENWFVMVNAPHDVGQDWESFRNQTRQRVIEKLNHRLDTQLNDHIVEEAYLDPPMIDQKTHSHTGSLYGTSSNHLFSAFLRHANFSRELSGLYFAGGSVHPGGGIPLCLQSGKITAELIQKEYGTRPV